MHFVEGFIVRLAETVTQGNGAVLSRELCHVLFSLQQCGPISSQATGIPRSLSSACCFRYHQTVGMLGSGYSNLGRRL